MPLTRLRHGLGLGLVALVLVTSVGACEREPEGDDEVGEDEGPQVEQAHAPNLQWKRAHAVQQDLMQALELEADEVCLEVGTAPCVDQVHLVALGGHDPFDLGLYESLDAPLTTTPIALDRVVLSACVKRVELDRDGEGVVFGALDLEAPTPAADDAALSTTTTNLYRRFLARDPLEPELAIIAKLGLDDEGQPVVGHEFASLACYAIGTTSEFLFF
jgi:hypothetical protein